MSIFKGSEELTAIQLGGQDIKEVYAGSTKVWPSGPSVPDLGGASGGIWDFTDLSKLLYSDDPYEEFVPGNPVREVFSDSQNDLMNEYLLAASPSEIATDKGGLVFRDPHTLGALEGQFTTNNPSEGDFYVGVAATGPVYRDKAGYLAKIGDPNTADVGIRIPFTDGNDLEWGLRDGTYFDSPAYISAPNDWPVEDRKVIHMQMTHATRTMDLYDGLQHELSYQTVDTKDWNNQYFYVGGFSRGSNLYGGIMWAAIIIQRIVTAEERAEIDAWLRSRIKV